MSNKWVSAKLISECGFTIFLTHMTVVSMDDRGRVTIPPELRESLGTKRFILHLDEDGLHLVPLPDPKTLRGSLKIPYSDEEMEEAAEAVILKRR